MRVHCYCCSNSNDRRCSIGTAYIQSSNGWNNYTLPVYYSEFHVLHIQQLYTSIKTFSYCSMKITKVLNNNGACYAIVLRFPMIQSAQLVEVTYKRLLMKNLHSASILLSLSYSAYSSRIRFYSNFSILFHENKQSA